MCWPLGEGRHVPPAGPSMPPCKVGTQVLHCCPFSETHLQVRHHSLRSKVVSACVRVCTCVRMCVWRVCVHVSACGQEPSI